MERNQTNHYGQSADGLLDVYHYWDFAKSYTNQGMYVVRR